VITSHGLSLTAIQVHSAGAVTVMTPPPPGCGNNPLAGETEYEQATLPL
jgi:hypothetical protein